MKFPLSVVYQFLVIILKYILSPNREVIKTLAKKKRQYVVIQNQVT